MITLAVFVYLSMGVMTLIVAAKVAKGYSPDESMVKEFAILIFLLWPLWIIAYVCYLIAVKAMKD